MLNVVAARSTCLSLSVMLQHEFMWSRPYSSSMVGIGAMAETRVVSRDFYGASVPEVM